MHPVETVLALLVPTTVLAVVARRLSVPYPIVLVIGGSLLAFVPGLPEPRLDPQLVFLLFLPPILYAAAYFTSWRDFRDNLLSISLLAVGLVAATTAAVALAFHAVVPEAGWGAAFVLGAIVSPPDAVAATAIARRLHLPRRIVTILEGESLVNDATGLVLLKFATAAVVTGSFSAGEGALDFVLLVAGGLAVGIAVGVGFAKVQRFLDDSVLAATASLLVSFLTYIVAERLHVSGVLAVVAAGLIQGRAVPHVWNAKVRIEATAFWDTVVFVLNALIFVLIGLQLRSVVAGLSGFSTGDGRGRRLRDARGGGRDPDPLDVPRRLPPAPPFPFLCGAEPEAPLALGPPRRVDGDAGDRLARGGARPPFADGLRGALSRP